MFCVIYVTAYWAPLSVRMLTSVSAPSGIAGVGMAGALISYLFITLIESATKS